jgi:hypothetical protein
MPAWFRILTFTILMIAWIAPQSAGALPGAGSPLRAGETYPGTSHAWAVLPSASGRGYLLVHLPPRTASEGKSGAAAGSVRSGYRLEEAPESMAAFGERVYLFFRPKPRGDSQHAAQRAVFSQSVRRFAQSELWVDEPSGRLETVAAIPDVGDLLATAADDRGPIALLQRAGSAELLILADGEWKKLELPAEVASGIEFRSGPVGLCVEASMLRIAIRRGQQFMEASTTLESLRSPTHSWALTRQDVSGFAALGSASQFLRSVGRWIVSDTVDASRIVLHVIDGAKLTALATVDVPHSVRTVTVQPAAGRWIVLSTQSPSTPRDMTSVFAQDAPTRVTEVSLLTGALLYNDRLHAASPLGTNEFRVLAVLLMLAMAMVLVLVLRGQPDAIHLPEGFAFAEPVRRIVAGVFDVGLAALLLPRVIFFTSSGTGDLFALFDPQTWMSGDAVRILLTLATIGVVIGTLTEWLFGRTPGKLITDCEVVAIVAGAEKPQNTGEVSRPSLASSLIRNCVKWFLSPVAILALFDDSGRHRGDQIARAAVVVEIRDEDEVDDAE